MAIGYDKIKNIQWFSLVGKFLSGMSFLQFMPLVDFVNDDTKETPNSGANWHLSFKTVGLCNCLVPL